MIEGVGELLRRVAAQAVLPRFRRLGTTDIDEKSPGEIVTTADREAETLLTAALLDMAPGSKVVGEEAASAEPGLRDLLRSENRVWLIDPLDGTANFVEGNACFSMMIALVERGQTVASWMLDPPRDVLAVAQRGGGAYIGGARIRTAITAPTLQDMHGAILKRFLPAQIRAEIETREAQVGGIFPGLGCAGQEYPSIATGCEHFALFWRTEPWDHAPGVLFLEEAGGFAARFDGTAYEPADGRSGLLAAQNREVWDIICRHFPVELMKQAVQE